MHAAGEQGLSHLVEQGFIAGDDSGLDERCFGLNVFVGDGDAILDGSGDGQNFEANIREREKECLTKIDKPLVFGRAVQVGLVMQDHDIQIAAWVELSASVSAVGDDGELARVFFRLGLIEADLLVEGLDDEIEDFGAGIGDDEALATGTVFDFEPVGLDFEEIPILRQRDISGRLAFEAQELLGAGFGFFQ